MQYLNTLQKRHIIYTAILLHRWSFWVLVPLLLFKPVEVRSTHFGRRNFAWNTALIIPRSALVLMT